MPERATPRICAAVDDHLSELLAEDVVAEIGSELEPHAASCPRCARRLAAFAALIADLKSLPLAASSRRSWLAIERQVAREPRRASIPFALESLALAAAGLVVAAALFVRSEAIADWLAPRFVLDTAFKPFLLPGMFALFGALASAAALPLLSTIALPKRAPAP